MSEYEVRKLPKKTIIYITIIIIAGIIGFFLVMQGKETKVEKILYTLGYKNVKDVMVYAEHEFLNEAENIKGKQYKVEFINLDDGKKCHGFVFKDYKQNHMKDLECN